MLALSKDKGFADISLVARLAQCADCRSLVCRHKRVDRSMQSETSKYSATFPAIKALLSKLGFRFNANAETGSIVISPERLLRWKALVEK